MADVELVIKVNKGFIDTMNSIKDDRELSWAQLLTVYRGFHAMLQNGTPLPKGHGKIGDLGALREEVSSWGMNDYEPSDFIDVIDTADAIIEADKTESEG